MGENCFVLFVVVVLIIALSRLEHCFLHQFYSNTFWFNYQNDRNIVVLQLEVRISPNFFSQKEDE